MNKAGKALLAAWIVLIALLFALPASANPGDVLTAPTPVPTIEPTPAPTQEPPEWADAYLKSFSEREVSSMRCFMMLADLDFNGTPELLFGRLNDADGEIEVDVMTISGGRAIRALEGTINGAYNFASANLTLYHEKKGYQWTLVTTGNESKNGRWQTRYSDVMFTDGTVRHYNRFTKRTSNDSNVYYIEGERVSEDSYQKQFEKQRAKLKMVGRVPQVSLGAYDDPPALSAVSEAFSSLVERYEYFARPSKIELLPEKKKLKLNEKIKTKLEISTSYGAATKSAVSYSVSDPKILSVSSKGVVKAVGYGSAAVLATLPSGIKTGVKISVPRPKVKKITVTSDSTTMKRGEQMQMYYRLSPAAARAKIRWYSSDASVVQVDESSGLATALKRGGSLVSCFVGAKLRGSTYITVENGEYVAEITLSDAELRLSPGDRYALGVSLAPQEATNKALSFHSSDERVASVNQAGRIEAKGLGSCEISATAYGGVSASLKLSVAETSYLMDARIADGVYEFVLPRQGAPLLMLDTCEPGEGAPLVPRMRQGAAARMRFALKNVGNGEVEIRPIVAFSRYLSIRDTGAGSQLGIHSDASEQERRFKLTRFSDGSYTLYLAARPTVSFGASGQQLGVPAQVREYAENKRELKFRLSPVGVMPGDSSWIERLLQMLGADEAEIAGATHIQLCDLDFNGSPELVVFTDKHQKGPNHGKTARRALIYAGDSGAGLIGSFEYEPAGSEDFGDTTLPVLRRLVNQHNGQRSWVLTDGSRSSGTGCARYVSISYLEGVTRQRTLFEKSWRPMSGTDGLMDERFYKAGKELTSYMYDQEFQKQFEDYVWREGASELIDCRGMSFEDLSKQLRILLARGDWFK